MLLVPWLVGSVYGLRAGSSSLRDIAGLLAALLAGYLFFNAASLWLKAAPIQRRRFVRPILVYGVAATVLAVIGLVATRGGLAGWAVPLVPLAVVALQQARVRKDRSLLSGAVTVAAACLLLPIAAAPDVRQFGHLTAATWAATLACFGYFAGTILYVKTMLRQRGRQAWLNASVGYHAVLAALSALAGQGCLAGLFVVTTIRAGWMPYLALRRPVRPATIGMIEIALSAWLTWALIG